ncbi:MAG: hypothetical protein A2937_03365 [Candidatus Yonathbacteria bacterium RIFCSPLOWO2_01_FULL_47_33b]|uniref:Uncharacterized protein n=1 Tax=Candidatus Yonathbacteria bacterium RIFCSPLOWO2_01_FULL_47_33b TaxID=1802727 RepID=A0A1G2SH28_9BACT|nr:MAG: hypothetical protein A2937_03365 [Candidatus Yonathbacteria bacterium RIFCSPLOWO2_01_FULL_47_33b]
MKHIPNFSEEDIKGISQAVKEMVEKATPLPGNKCHDCEGEVVKKAQSLLRGKFGYAVPECRNCGRTYLYAENVRSGGTEEFLDLLNKPYF